MRRSTFARSSVEALLFVAGAACIAACGSRPDASATKEAWDSDNDPALMGEQSVDVFSLPLKAELEAKAPWSGYWWPTYKGGVSLRWQSDPNTDSYRDYLYTIPTQAQLAAMTPDQLATLSPAEKYDLYTGHPELPLTNALRQQMLSSVGSDGQVPSWYGICHGLAAAATTEPQPGAATVTLQDGRALTFYYSDLEALLDQTFADTSRYSAKFEGVRCDENPIKRDSTGRPVDAACRDINPGTLHLVLAGYMAHGTSFIGDMSPGPEVWNYAVTGYTFTLGQKRTFDSTDPEAAYRAPGTAYLLDVDVAIDTAAAASPGKQPPAIGRSQQTFSYTLELDQNDKILGGEWRSDTHPDFVWQVVSTPRDGDGLLPVYKTVKELIAKSLPPGA